MEPEVITRTERPPGETEPRLTLTELRGLLADAAAFERAQRPIVLHEATQPVPAPQTAPAGASVYVPMPPAQPYAATAVLPPEKRNPWPLIFVASMAGVISTGYACAATGSAVAVLAVTGFAGTWCLSVYRLVFSPER